MQSESSPKSLLKFPHALDRSFQSATHSATLPTMSKWPVSETQPAREPVGSTSSASMLQSLEPLSTPGSGVPSAAICHSWFVASRFPALRHAAAAWNQLRNLAGATPGMDTAYAPVQPLAFEGQPGSRSKKSRPRWVAAPRSDADATLDFLTFLISFVSAA